MITEEHKIDVVFNPAEVVADLIRSQEDALSLLKPFEYLCYTYYEKDDADPEWMATLNGLRSLLSKWDEPASPNDLSEFERRMDFYLDKVQAENHEEAYFPELLGLSLGVAYRRNKQRLER